MAFSNVNSQWPIKRGFVSLGRRSLGECETNECSRASPPIAGPQLPPPNPAGDTVFILVKDRSISFNLVHSEKDSRDPEDRLVDERDLQARKDKMFDKTVADTFPASDPLSSLPDPDEDSFAA